MRINNLPNATRWELINMYAVSVLFIYFLFLQVNASQRFADHCGQTKAKLLQCVYGISINSK